MRYTIFSVYQGELSNREELNNLDELNVHMANQARNGNFIVVGTKENDDSQARVIIRDEGWTVIEATGLSINIIRQLETLGFANLVNKPMESSI